MKTNVKVTTMIVAMSLCFLVSAAWSENTLYTGEWSTGDTWSFGGPFSGTWSFTFDDDGLGPGTYSVALDEFTFTGTNYGGFDISNVQAVLEYYPGEGFHSIYIGCVTPYPTQPVSGVLSVQGYTNDFWVHYDAGGLLHDSVMGIIFVEDTLVTYVNAVSKSGSFTMDSVVSTQSSSWDGVKTLYQ